MNNTRQLVILVSSLIVIMISVFFTSIVYVFAQNNELQDAEYLEYKIWVYGDEVSGGGKILADAIHESCRLLGSLHLNVMIHSKMRNPDLIVHSLCVADGLCDSDFDRARESGQLYNYAYSIVIKLYNPEGSIYDERQKPDSGDMIMGAIYDLSCPNEKGTWTLVIQHKYIPSLNEELHFYYDPGGIDLGGGILISMSSGALLIIVTGLVALTMIIIYAKVKKTS